jgi:hypothetical protein
VTSCAHQTVQTQCKMLPDSSWHVAMSPVSGHCIMYGHSFTGGCCHQSETRGWVSTLGRGAHGKVKTWGPDTCRMALIGETDYSLTDGTDVSTVQLGQD